MNGRLIIVKHPQGVCMAHTNIEGLYVCCTSPAIWECHTRFLPYDIQPYLVCKEHAFSLGDKGTRYLTGPARPLASGN